MAELKKPAIAALQERRVGISPRVAAPLAIKSLEDAPD